jgi:hypothetical protein
LPQAFNANFASACVATNWLETEADLEIEELDVSALRKPGGGEDSRKGCLERDPGHMGFGVLEVAGEQLDLEKLKSRVLPRPL